MDKFIAALDLGTSTIRGVVGKKHSNGKITVIAMESVKSDGITRGLIINVDKVVRLISELALALERSCGKKIEKFYVGTGGSFVYAKESSAYKRLSEKGSFSDEIIADLHKENESVNLEYDAEVLKVLSQKYIIDNEFIETNPTGAHGSKIEGEFIVLGVKRNDKKTIQECVEKAGFKVAGFVITPLATADTVLSNEEKELGAVSVDIGAGKTCVTVFQGGKLKRVAVLPFGGNVVTKDLASGCNILWEKAEKAKVRHGSALAEFQSNDNKITVSAAQGWEAKEVSFKTLAFIIQARVEEILSNVLFQIEKSTVYEQLGAGIVITGGTAKLNDILRLVTLKTGLEVRFGMPSKQQFLNLDNFGKDHTDTTLLGILSNGEEDCVKSEEFKSLNPQRNKPIKKKNTERTGNLFGNLLKSVDNFFDDDDKSM